MVPYYGKVWYDDKFIANILSLTNLVHNYIVFYDSYQYNYFTVHTNIGSIKLRRNKQCLYVFKPTYTTSKSNVVTIVEVNMVGFTIRQIDRFKLASKICSNVRLPTVKNFKHMVFTNMIADCLISVSDIINTKVHMVHQFQVSKESHQGSNQVQQ